MNKKISILLFFLFVLISMSAVSAVDADGNNDTIVSSADAEALAIENDVNAIDDLGENVADGGDEALANDSASVSVDKNKEILQKPNSDDVLGGETTNTWYVNASATGGDGKTPETAFKTLKDALTNSELQDGNTIMIASGTYTGTNNTVLNIYMISPGEYNPSFTVDIGGTVKNIMTGDKIKKGSVKLYLNGENVENVTVDVDDGSIFASLGVLNAGNYTVKAVYHDDTGEFKDCEWNSSLEIKQAPTEIKLVSDTGEMSVGAIAHVAAELSPSEAGNLSYASNDTSIVDVSSTGVIVANGAGTALITVSFAGDDKYAEAENKTITLTVNLNPASVSVNNSTLELYVDDNFTIVATTSPAGLNVTFVQDDSGVYTVDSNGVVIALKEGTGNVLVKVGGDGVYAENSTEIAVTVSKIPTEVIVQNATIEMKVTDEVSPVVSIMPSDAGELDFTSSDVSVVTVNGIGTITAVGEGVANVTVRFMGNDKYSAAESKNITVTVSKIATEIVALPVTTVYNVGENLVITLKDENGNPLNNTEITVNLNGVGTFITDENGQVNISTRPLLPDFYMAEITFKGNDVYDKSAKSVKVKIQKVATKITMKSRTYKVTTKVKKYTIAIKNNKGIPLYNKKVYIIVRGVTYSAITDSQGFATFKITNLNKKGTFKATAYYNGNNINKRTTNQAQLVVK